MSDEKAKKVRLGQYYTDPLVVKYMVSLSDKNTGSKVLEPSFGEGAFLSGLTEAGYKDITAYDIDADNYKKVSKEFDDFNLKLLEQSFLDVPTKEKFDLIIGNPPYVSWKNIDSRTKEFLQTDSFWKSKTNGEWDLLYAFIIWSIELLKEKGELIFIVPYNWFSSTYAQGLRDFISDKGFFKEIIHFNEYKIFKDAAPNAIIFKYIKDSHRKQNSNSQPVHTIEYKSRKDSTKNIISSLYDLRKSQEFEDDNWRVFLSETDCFKKGSRWFLASPEELKHINQIESLSKQTLGSVARIGVGMVSGYDQAYLISKEELKSFNSEEKKYIHPFIKAKDCQPFYLKDFSYYIFADKIKTEAELQTYPNLFKHLKNHKPALLNRYGIKEETWWHWATVRNLKLFEKRGLKIFVPCIDRSLRSRYALSGGSFAAGDVLTILPDKTDPILLLAWLNSKSLIDWYLAKGNRSGQRILYTQSVIENLPFVDLSALDKKSKSQLIANTKQLYKCGTKEISLDERNRLIQSNDKIIENFLNRL